jgi:folate-binding protein YgfZ
LTPPFPENLLCALPDLAVLNVSGGQSSQYLQGQLTNDLNLLSQTQGQLNCHCDFKGKTWCVYHSLLTDHGIQLIANKQEIAASLPELKKFAVFSKVDIEANPHQLNLYGGFGSHLEDWITGQFGNLPKNQYQVVSNEMGWVLAFTSPVSRYLIGLTSSGQQALEHSSMQIESDTSAWQTLDILAGIPSLSAATTNEFVPQMLNMQQLNAISFDKGCYLGQEVVARTHYLGKNKRATYILNSEQPLTCESGEIVEQQVGDNWRRSGTVLNHANYADCAWLLAVLPNNVEADSCFRLKSSPDTLLSLYPLTYMEDSPS